LRKVIIAKGEIKIMKFCTICLYPDTKPGLHFDENGVCFACKWHELKNTIDWNSRKKELEKILDKYKNKDGNSYDCIIPISGGKDSHYLAYVIIKEFGLKPLLVNFHPLDQTAIGRENLENLKSLGADCIEFTPNPLVYKKLAKFGLVELGDYQWPEHLGIFTIPYKIAAQYKIPLLIWAETPNEYGVGDNYDGMYINDRKFQEKFQGFFLDKIKPEDMVKYNFEKRDLLPYFFPSQKETDDIGITGIFLGSYLKWDIFKQMDIVKSVGFKEDKITKEGTYDSWENLDVKYTVFHDYFKFLKFGFGRTTDHVSIEIRYGRMTRDEGLKRIKEFEGKIPTQYLDEFLTESELTKEEFLDICEKFTNKDLFKKDENDMLLRDENGDIEKITYDNN